MYFKQTRRTRQKSLKTIQNSNKLRIQTKIGKMLIILKLQLTTIEVESKAVHVAAALAYDVVHNLLINDWT